MRVRGKVVRGLGEGKTLGYPTANIEYTAHGLPAPRVGVYAGIAFLSDQPEKKFIAAVAVGSDHVSSKTPKLEVHLFDFEGDLYGKEMVLEIRKFIRDIRRFPNPVSLRAQIARDIVAILQSVKGNE